MPTIEEINKELKTGVSISEGTIHPEGNRIVFEVKRVEESHIILRPPFTEMALPKSSICGILQKIKKGDDIIVNELVENGRLVTKYYFPDPTPAPVENEGIRLKTEVGGLQIDLEDNFLKILDYGSVLASVKLSDYDAKRVRSRMEKKSD